MGRIRKSDGTFDRGALAVAILKYIAIGAVIGAVLVCPNLAQLYKLLNTESPEQKRRVRANLDRLQRRGLIRKGSDEGVYVPTPAGVKAAEFDTLTIKQTKWDGKWRLFMFDVPEAQRPARVALSKKVQEMGMVSYQKSVFISPYPCEEVLRAATKFLQVEKNVRLVVAEKISEEPRFKKAFGL